MQFSLSSMGLTPRPVTLVLKLFSQREFLFLLLCAVYLSMGNSVEQVTIPLKKLAARVASEGFTRLVYSNA